MTRQLDALVAERIEQWRWMAYPAPNSPKTSLLTGLFPPEAPERVCVPNRYDRIWEPSTADAPRFTDWDKIPWWEGDEMRHGFPAYSTDIAAAWQVVEKLRTNEWLVEIAGGSYWRCEVIDISIEGEDRGNHEGVSMDTAPLAIIIATLRAAGVPEEEIQSALEAQS